MPSDGEVIATANWSEPTIPTNGSLRYPLSVSTSFSLHPGSFSATNVESFLIGRGTSSGGQINIVEHDRSEKDDAVLVLVEARLRDPDDIETCSVVGLSRSDGSQGVGIYVSSTVI